MKKKITIALLFSLTAVCLGTAVACNDKGNSGNSSGTQTLGNTFTLTLQGGEGYSFIGDDLVYNPSTETYTVRVTENDTYTFELDLGAFYTGTPTLTVGGKALAEKDGAYSVTVDKNTDVAVSGIRKDVSTMLGSGSFDDAYVVSRPIDLVYIAEQVNKGNSTYSKAYYVLANDIDCKGEELQVIGDMNNQDAFFSGCFSCYSDENTGVMERYTISNFTINAETSGYAGLFGFVQADMSVTSSGLFYGIRIDNFTVNANANAFPVGKRAVFCGGLIGYGIGVKSYLCDATNGTINVNSDANEYAFVGGLMGIAQGAYNDAYNFIALSEIAYATVDVDVNILQGSTLAGGGIVGYTLTNSLVAPSFIHNSYATGNVNGAVRAGGLVGILGQHTSIASSYSSGNVVANARNSADTDAISKEACVAYAGGLVGYGENDSIVNDSFATGMVTAIAVDGASAQKTGKITAGMDEAGKIAVNTQKHEILNCPETVNVNSLIQLLTQELGWQTVNWNIQDKTLPTINYEASAESTTTVITVHYVTKRDNGVESVKVNSVNQESCSYVDQYAPFVDALNQGMLPQYAHTNDNGLLSYGFFFDEACTRPVPYSYVTTRSVDLYMGFADPTPIVGTYNVAVNHKTTPITISITKNREAFISDGATTTEASYYFDGKILTLEGVRLARFFDGEVDSEKSINEDTAFDMNRYQFAFFQAELIDQELSNGNIVKTLTLFDGVYYTKDAPLYAYTPNSNLTVGEYYVQDGENVTNYVFYPNQTGIAQGGMLGYAEFTYVIAETNVILTFENQSTDTFAIANLQSYDVFKGEWRKSASVNEFFSFDGMDGWTSFARVYTRNSATGDITVSIMNEKNGSYEIAGEQITLLLNGVAYKKAKFNAEGMLTIWNVEEPRFETVYSKTDAQLGLWDNGNGTTLQLHGFDKDGLGKADLHYTFIVEGYTYTSDHALTYQRSETENYYCLYQEDAPFGYFYYEEYNNVLIATLLNPTGDGEYGTYIFYLSHEINGEWISNDFNNIVFNGIGAFNSNGDWEGTLILNGEKVTYTLTKYTLSGSFFYQNEQYDITYNPTQNQVTITKANVSAEMQRQDELANIQFVDKNDTTVTVSFDGRGHLTDGGTMTVGSTNYTYKYVSEGIYDVTYANSEEGWLGQLAYNADTASYTFSFGATQYELYVRNDYMGEWAISGAFDAFTIYPSDLNGNIPAIYQGQNVLMSYIDSTTLTFDCTVNHMPKTFYVFLIKDKHGAFETFALSEYQSVAFGDYTICEKVDSLYGTWVYNTPSPYMQMSMTFDGVNNSYTNGRVNLTLKIGNAPATSTPYFYKTQDDGEIFIWSQSPIGDNTYYYKLVPCALEEPNAYVKGTRAYKRIAVDSLYKMQAKDTETGYTFTFDGNNLDDDNLGTVTATKDGEPTVTYTYDIVAFNANKTVTLTLTDKATNKTYTATMNYANANNPTITLVLIEGTE